MTKRVHLDANVILRFLRGDHEEHSQIAKKLLLKGLDGDLVLVVSPVVLQEVFYVLLRVYKVDRLTVVDLLLSLLNSEAVTSDDSDDCQEALRLMEIENIAFTDAYLASVSARLSEPLATFDRGIRKLKGALLYPLQ